MVTPFTPREGTGRSLRTLGVARALARSDDVTIAYVEFDGRTPSPILSQERIGLTPIHASRGMRRALTYTRARMAGIPPSFARGISPELVGTAGLGSRFDRVVAEGTIAAAALLLLGRSQSVIYDAQNFESGFRDDLSSAERHYGRPGQLREFERKLLAAASETWMPTPRDVESGAGLAPGAALRYVPNVIDARAIEPVAPAANGRILFVADFTYEPNRQALRFLVGEVMPRLWSTTPDAHLRVVGRSPEAFAGLDPRVEILGFVDDLAAQYASSTGAVVPLLVGGGSPLKFVEAMAYGLPVVASTVAARGLAACVPGVHFLHADGADAFASALASVIREDASAIGMRGRELVEREYSIEALAHLLQAH